ncbi:hypothetical protein THAOC_03556 [Thalassiosira oceanica]|uniref:Uncharacterized protein n=1 Tax=Thalassiosira oceanica TaxID=159749 RepID=K0TKT6_THAOC|nr:hypothetical protein THAOC_03556 [Thalassiosira oceanica]|eukprot:EJK74751.1 hypothetical protein THAOC_03556 [Thalassiosira oceanica]
MRPGGGIPQKSGRGGRLSRQQGDCHDDVVDRVAGEPQLDRRRGPRRRRQGKRGGALARSGTKATRTPASHGGGEGPAAGVQCGARGSSASLPGPARLADGASGHGLMNHERSRQSGNEYLRPRTASTGS